MLVGLRAYKQSYAGFLGELWRQCPHANGKAPPDLGKLVDKLEDSGQRVLLLLDNFDALLDNPDIDPKFDARFHDHLNSIKNHPRMALACVTLSGAEMRAEIRRRQPGLDVETAAAIFETVYSHGRSYALLTEILNKFANREDADWPMRKRLEEWRRQFETAANGFHISWASLGASL